MTFDCYARAMCSPRLQCMLRCTLLCAGAGQHALRQVQELGLGHALCFLFVRAAFLPKLLLW